MNVLPQIKSQALCFGTVGRITIGSFFFKSYLKCMHICGNIMNTCLPFYKNADFMNLKLII